MRRFTIAAAPVLGVVAILAAGCATLPPISPAPPPGTAEYKAAAESWKGVDGSVDVPTNKRARDSALVAIRNYCKGPFVVVREDKRLTMTPLSFPLPTKRVRYFFRCGDQDAPEDDFRVGVP